MEVWDGEGRGEGGGEFQHVDLDGLDGVKKIKLTLSRLSLHATGFRLRCSCWLRLYIMSGCRKVK